MRASTASVTTLAAAFVQARFAPNFSEVLEHERLLERWHRLVRGRVQQLPSHQRALAARAGELTDAFGEVLARLTPADRATLVAFVDSQGLQHSVRESTAFDLGVALGRSLGAPR